MNWYIACPFVSFDIGGSTPYASQVRKKILQGIFPIEGWMAFDMKSRG
jgi:hypothetical protein